MKHTHALGAAAILAIAIGISACDKLRTVYCTTALPALAKVCQTQVDAVISLEKGK